MKEKALLLRALEWIGIICRGFFVVGPAEIHGLAGNAHQLQLHLHAFTAAGCIYRAGSFGGNIVDGILFRLEDLAAAAKVLHGHHYVIQLVFCLVAHYQFQVLDAAQEAGAVIIGAYGNELLPVTAVIGALFYKFPLYALLLFLAFCYLFRHAAGGIKAFLQVAVLIQQPLILRQDLPYPLLLAEIPYTKYQGDEEKNDGIKRSSFHEILVTVSLPQKK